MEIERMYCKSLIIYMRTYACARTQDTIKHTCTDVRTHALSLSLSLFHHAHSLARYSAIMNTSLSWAEWRQSPRLQIPLERNSTVNIAGCWRKVHCWYLALRRVPWFYICASARIEACCSIVTLFFSISHLVTLRLYSEKIYKWHSL